MKLVINRAHSQFELSPTGAQALYDSGCIEIAVPKRKVFGVDDRLGHHGFKAQKKLFQEGKDCFYNFSSDFEFVFDISKIKRNNTYLVTLVEMMGAAAGKEGTNLMVVDVPFNYANTVFELDSTGEFVHEAYARFPGE